MAKPGLARSSAALLAAALLLLTGGAALAQALPGLPAPAPQGEAPGWLAQLYAWIQGQQALLQRDLAALLRALKQGESGALVALLGGSFLYGVLHAAGPGHGKLVISSYVFANGSQVRSGLWLTLISSLAQAVSAILLVGILVMILDQARLETTRRVYLLELVSYGLIVLIGLVMLWRLLRGRTHSDHAHGHDHDQHGHQHGADCGHGHHHAWTAPIKAMPRRDFWAMVLSVGIRPCSGAVIVLLFTLGQGLLAAGLGATFAMAFGTALTVGILAVFAVAARRTALAMAGRSNRAGRLVAQSAALFGSFAVIFFGGLLFWATWTMPPTY